MAFDDDKIRIEVEGAQAAAQLEALAGEVQSLEKELEDLNNTAGVTNAEIEGTTRRLEEAKGKFAEASEAVRENASAQEEAGGSTKSLADKYVTLGLKVFGARQVLMAAGEAMRSVAQATGDYSGATKDAIDETDNLLKSIASLDLIGASKALGQLAGQTVAWAEGINEVNTELGNMVDKKAVKAFADLLAAQRDLVEGHKEEIAALDLKAKALAREIDSQQKNGEVQQFLKDKLKELLDEYEKRGEAVPRILQEEAFELNVVSTETEKLGEKSDAAHKKAAAAAKVHADALDAVVASLDGDSKARERSTALLLEAIKVTESHGVVTVESQKKIKAGIEEELAKYTEYGDKVPAALQAAASAYRAIAKEQEQVIANAAKVIADIDAAAIKANQAQAAQGGAAGQANAANAEKLKEQIKAIEDSPIITLDQQNNLDNLKNQLLDNTRAAGELNRAFTVTAENYLTDEEALAKYNAELALLQDAQARVAYLNDNAQATEEELAAARWDNLEALNKMEDAAGDLGGSYDALRMSTKKAGDAAASIGDDAKKGTDKASEGLDKMKGGLEEAIPLAEQLRGILQEIVALGAQADI